MSSVVSFGTGLTAVSSGSSAHAVVATVIGSPGAVVFEHPGLSGVLSPMSPYATMSEGRFDAVCMATVGALRVRVPPSAHTSALIPVASNSPTVATANVT